MPVFQLPQVRYRAILALMALRDDILGVKLSKALSKSVGVQNGG